MKSLTILIPTRNRLDSLRRTLASIPEDLRVNVSIVCDGDRTTFDALGRGDHWEKIALMDQHAGSVACRNWLAPAVADGLLYATDDIEFDGAALLDVFDQFNARFPDDDGVIGLRQNRDHHETGVALMGAAFLDRYPARQPFYPGYWHFSAQEVLWLARSVGRYEPSDRVVVNHAQTMFDATGKEARAHKARDMAMIRRRKEDGLIWGA